MPTFQNVTNKKFSRVRLQAGSQNYIQVLSLCLWHSSCWLDIIIVTFDVAQIRSLDVAQVKPACNLDAAWMQPECRLDPLAPFGPV